MRISVVGAGYVGLVSASCLADSGHNVICIDNDEKKVSRLKTGVIDIFEPGLKDIIENNLKSGNLIFSEKIENGLVKDIEIIFIAVDTPPMSDGSSDLNNLMEVASKIGSLIDDTKIIAIKSTVPVGTSELVENKINTILISAPKPNN